MALDTTIGGDVSDSYGSLAEADAYFAARQTGNWDGSDASKEMALRRAATYLDNVYRGKWKGVRTYQVQSLAWPRANVTDSDGYYVDHLSIPENLKRAQFEAAAIIAAGTNLEAAIERATKKEKVAVIEVEYMDGAALATQYPAISNYLTDLVLTGAGVNSSVGIGRVIRG